MSRCAGTGEAGEVEELDVFLRQRQSKGPFWCLPVEAGEVEELYRVSFLTRAHLKITSSKKIESPTGAHSKLQV